MMRNQKGITLIALVITIIVLLILAGVSIAMLTGENGLLNRATSSKQQTTAGEAVERINLALNAVKTEIYAQQVKDDSWEPVTGETPAIQDAIKTVLTKDGFVENATTDYGFKLDGTSIVLTYDNATLEITGITGSITTSSPYTITKAEIPASL